MVHNVGQVFWGVWWCGVKQVISVKCSLNNIICSSYGIVFPINVVANADMSSLSESVIIHQLSMLHLIYGAPSVLSHMTLHQEQKALLDIVKFYVPQAILAWL